MAESLLPEWWAALLPQGESTRVFIVGLPWGSHHRATVYTLSMDRKHEQQAYPTTVSQLLDDPLRFRGLPVPPTHLL